MPFRPRELVIRAREAATLLLSTLDRNEMVERFLDVYAAEFRRPGRADRPGLYREQRETIRRECILAMVQRIESAVPARLKVRVIVREPRRRSNAKKRKKGKKPPALNKRRKPGMDSAIPLLDLFREEFFVALGQALDWNEQDAQEFWRDLELYEKLSDSQSRVRNGVRARGATAGPFVDRTALLLDPSLMEQARRQAGKFQVELMAAAERVLRKTFSARRRN